MSDLKSALLPNRGVISLTGADAGKLLQGVITADMDSLGTQRNALHSGLLTPQGKILFEFFVVRHHDGYLIETDKHTVLDLVKRLSMYKLRAAVELADVSADYTVAAVWGTNSNKLAGNLGCVTFVDPRLSELGARLLLTLTNDEVLKDLNADASSEPAYDAHRIALGAPEAGKDFKLGDTFPHEALYDQLGSVSFTKGCFVGQEVESRMQHRVTARKRVVPIATTSQTLPDTGAEIRGGASSIGTLGTVAGGRALAMLRLDRAAEALRKGETLIAGEIPVSIEIPAWATFALPGAPKESEQ